MRLNERRPEISRWRGVDGSWHAQVTSHLPGRGVVYEPVVEKSSHRHPLLSRLTFPLRIGLEEYRVRSKVRKEGRIRVWK